jgi:hypothetical protein
MKIKPKIISKFHIKVICNKFRYLDKKILNSNEGSYEIKLSTHYKTFLHSFKEINRFEFFKK